MTEYIARVATTGLIEQAGTTVRLTKEFLESIRDQVNSDRCLPFVVEHDPFCMPIGKINEAWIEPFEDEYAAMARIHVEDDALRANHTRSSTELVYLNFADVPKPFVREFKNTDRNLMTLSVDLANFDSTESHATFMDAVTRVDDEISCRNVGRHSLVPEPLIQLVLTHPELCAALSVGLWVVRRVEKFVRYTIDETLKKTADDISDSLSAIIRRIVSAYKQCKSDDDRPILAEVVVPGQVAVILLIKIDHAEEFPSIDLSEVTAEMEKYGDLLQQAEEITLARTDSGGWEFQYLKTRKGEVFGTLECYKRTLEQLRRAQEDSEFNKS